MPFTSDAAAAPFPATDDAAVTSHSAIQDRQEQTLFSKTRRMIWELSVACRKPAVVCEGTAYACEDPTNRDHEDALKTGIGCGILGSFAVSLSSCASERAFFDAHWSFTTLQGLFS